MGKLKAPVWSEDRWQEHSTSEAIKAIRRIATANTAMPAGTPVGKLSDIEWGWLFAAGLYEWLAVRAQQATVEGISVEDAVREGARRIGTTEPDAWQAGMIKTILPKLAEEPFDWDATITSWSEHTMICFLCAAYRLMRDAEVCRDRNGGIVERKPWADVAYDARTAASNVNAAAGGPRAPSNPMQDDSDIPQMLDRRKTKAKTATT
jgi:hypothetical protein